MVGRRDNQILCFYLAQHLWYDIYNLQYVLDEDIDEFQGVIGQLPDDFSDDFREFVFYFIDQKGFLNVCRYIRMFRSAPFIGWQNCWTYIKLQFQKGE